MAAPAHMAAAMTRAEMIAVLTWWFVLLAGAATLMRRFQPRGTSAARRLLRRRDRGSSRSCLEAQPSGAPVPAGYAARRRASVSHHRSALPSATLEPLCRYIDFRRRLELASAELQARLSQLPGDRWRIEAYPLTGERRNTLLVLGETGVFVISATYAPGHWDDVVTVDKLAQKIGLLLPGYEGAVQAAICQPFTSAAPPVWHRPDDQYNWIAAWVLGGDHVVQWLEHFGHKHRLSPNDLRLFDQLAKPNWLKAAILSPPSWPPVPESTPPGSAG
ncbi:MAG: hypothetical protein ACTHQQ_15285 [Solirubrobacteraceae bacterium]